MMIREKENSSILYSVRTRGRKIPHLYIYIYICLNIFRMYKMDYFCIYFNYNQVIEKAHSFVFLLVNTVASDNSTTSVPTRLGTVKSAPKSIFFNLLSPVTSCTAIINKYSLSFINLA